MKRAGLRILFLQPVARFIKQYVSWTINEWLLTQLQTEKKVHKTIVLLRPSKLSWDKKRKSANTLKSQDLPNRRSEQVRAHRRDFDYKKEENRASTATQGQNRTGLETEGHMESK